MEEGDIIRITQLDVIKFDMKEMFRGENYVWRDWKNAT